MITMSKYEITVTETCNVAYIVEANNHEEAMDLFSKWVDGHQEWVADDLLDSSCGWEYSLVEVPDSFKPDITLSSLEE